MAGTRANKRTFVLELVRALDEASFALTLSPNAAELVRNDWARHHIIKGASTALLPLLQVLRDDPGPVPWGPTTPELAAAADEHLVNCGKWNAVQRLLELERYGLASTKFVSETHLVVEVEPDDEEFAEASSGHWLSTQKRETRRADETRLGDLKPSIAANIDRYADVDDGWFLRYSPPAEIMRYHHDYAALYAFGIAEADALPESVVLDGRTFGDWTAASTAALGRILHHIACATRLRARHASLELRNLLTVFARREDVTEIWLEAGETDDWAAKIIRGLTLDVPSAAHAVNTHEIPLPYYVDFGRHFLLLPIFGGLLNAHAGLVWHLQRSYRAHWDRAVEAREQKFRSDLRELFPRPRYAVPGRSFVLRRDDRTVLTDVDAVIIENHTGTLFLVQLKWPDIYGTSLAERDSRRINLLDANDWVSRVSGWVGGRSSAEIAKSIGLDASGSQSPVFLVVARHTARFSAKAKYDRRAHWISWPGLVQLRNEFPSDDLEALLRNAEQPDRLAHQPRRRPRIAHYQFPGLDVEARFS